MCFSVETDITKTVCHFKYSEKTKGHLLNVFILNKATLFCKKNVIHYLIRCKREEVQIITLSGDPISTSTIYFF